ncbi:MAG: bifunctional diaminohydroxyphosphoribosylaminopyrimidine deaminase/5-amino-6-(5-phosphoribosylamino)uracil reductase RibD [Candidatus Nanopelagicales bacterium]
MSWPTSQFKISEPELTALAEALALAQTPGVPLAPNPRVGCVLLHPDGAVIASGFHRGAGTPHAEVAALAAAREAGEAVTGATAVVTLEPCNHTGRTGPCAQALIEAGIGRVVFAQADPNPVAAGGAERLRAAGVEVVGGVRADAAEAVNEAWTFAVTHGRPLVTWKVAATLDGRIAAADGSSRWITSEAARAQVHELRSRVQAVVVGTGTALIDDPSLTARTPAGDLLAVQPLRVVVGRRVIPPTARLRDGGADLLVMATHDPHDVLRELHRREVRHALLEGGPRLAAAFVQAALIDRVTWYVAPALLGAGKAAVDGFGVADIGGIRRLEIRTVEQVGPDLRIDARFG